MSVELLVRELGLQPYQSVLASMQAFTDGRDDRTPDELWLLQHEPVYTLGQAGKVEHLLAPGNIPVIQSDRGGQVTYHGPGQLIAYLLLDVKRRGIGVRSLVTGIEKAVISLLAAHGVLANARKEAPGVYVEGRKIAALGLRIRRGRSYHGLSLNVDMDLAPFANINPCGFEGLEVIDMRSAGIATGIDTLAQELVDILADEFGYHARPVLREI